MTLWTGSGLFNIEIGQVIMIAIGLLLLYLAINKKFEPLLLVPIGFGGILANIPESRPGPDCGGKCYPLRA